MKEHLGLGAVLASLVVLLFLGNIRSTIIAAVAIPTSIIGTFMCMWWMGFTINTITLLALALAVGIVIDDAIVVLENIFRWIDEKKIRPMPAAIGATKEIGLAVLATTLSLMAVFLPVAFMQSIPGRFLRSFGLTMGASIAISLLVSFTLTPMLASRLLKLDPPPASGARTCSSAWSTCSIARSSASTWACSASRMRRRCGSCLARLRSRLAIGLRACPPGRRRCPRASCRRTTRRSSRSSVRTPEGTSLAATADRVRADRARPARMARGDDHPADHRRQPAEDAQPGADLRAPACRPISASVTQDQLQDRVRREIAPTLPKEYRVNASQVAAFGAGTFSTATVQYILAARTSTGSRSTPTRSSRS